MKKMIRKKREMEWSYENTFTFSAFIHNFNKSVSCYWWLPRIFSAIYTNSSCIRNIDRRKKKKNLICINKWLQCKLWWFLFARFSRFFPSYSLPFYVYSSHIIHTQKKQRWKWKKKMRWQNVMHPYGFWIMSNGFDTKIFFFIR